MRHIKEEWPLFVFLNERHCALGVLRGKLFLVLAGDFGVDDLVAVNERQMRPALEPLLHWQVQDSRMVRPHVVGVRQPKVIIKAMLHRQKFFVVTEVPLAVTGRGVTLLFADFGQGHLAGVDAVGRLRPQCAENAHANVVAAGEQSRARGAAHCLGHIKIRELPAFLCHAVKVRCRIIFRAKGADVGITHVINENDDDVGRSFLSLNVE